MKAIADIGQTLKVTPWDDVYYKTTDEVGQYIDDRTPFFFQVDEHVYDGQIFYGICGPVVAGPTRYQGLICNILVRVDGTDWRIETSSHANFVVGPAKVARNHCYDFRHPEGNTMEGYPQFSRFGAVEIADADRVSPI